MTRWSGPQPEAGETLPHRGGAVFALRRVFAWLAAFFGLLVFAPRTRAAIERARAA